MKSALGLLREMTVAVDAAHQGSAVPSADHLAHVGRQILDVEPDPPVAGPVGRRAVDDSAVVLSLIHI